MTAIAARLHPAGRRELTLAVAAAVSTAVVWIAAPAFSAGQPGIAAFPTNGFADGLYIPVREIEHVQSTILGNDSRPSTALVHVRCAGRARRTSLCWVARR